MKKIIYIPIVTTVIFFTGCNQASPQVPQTKQQHKMTEKEKNIQAIKNLPQWVINPQSKGGITAVGMAGYSRHGLRVMRPQAEMDARAKLAGQIEILVSSSQQQAMRAVQNDNVDTMENLFYQSTKEVVKQIPLSGAVVVNQKMMDNGDYYVQMTIKKQEIVQEVDKQQNIYKKNLQNSNLSKKSIDEGMKILDKMMKQLEEDTQ